MEKQNGDDFVMQKHRKRVKIAEIGQNYRAIEGNYEISDVLYKLHEAVRCVKSSHKFRSLRYRKYMLLMELWSIERGRGFFSPSDVGRCFGDKTFNNKSKYWERLLREGYIVEVSIGGRGERVRAVTTVYFQIMSRVVWSVACQLNELHGLGADDFMFQPQRLVVDGVMLRVLRLEVGASVDEMCDRLGVKGHYNYLRYELCFRAIPMSLSERIIEVFYFKIPRVFWTEKTKKLYAEGKLVFPYFERGRWNVYKVTRDRDVLFHERDGFFGELMPKIKEKRDKEAENVKERKDRAESFGDDIYIDTPNVW